MPGPCICSGLSVANCLRQLCPLGTRSLSAQASVCGSRTVGRPEFIRGVQFRPLGRNSLTTFRGQTALRGCPRARGVRCRIAPCRSLCSPPPLPAGRFGLRPRPHWGHASLRDSSLRSPAGKKPLIAHFAGGARYVARTLIGKISLAIVRAPNSPFSAVKMGGPFSLRYLSPLCSPAVGTGQTQRNASWDVSAEIGWLRSAKKRASFFLYNWHCTYSTNGAGMIRCCLDIFATQKASVISYPRWPFMRAMRPVAEWRPFLFNWRFTTPAPRAVAPVVPRR